MTLQLAEGSLDIPLSISAMMDLPKQERSKYLAMLPLTRTFVYGCLEYWCIRSIRKMIVRHGGTFREEYWFPGLSVTATFRDHKSMVAASRALAEWENDGIKKGLPRPQDYEGLLNDPETYGTEHKAPPALTFCIVDGIHHNRPVRVYKMNHPVKGGERG